MNNHDAFMEGLSGVGVCFFHFVLFHSAKVFTLCIVSQLIDGALNCQPEEMMLVRTG